MPGRVGPGWLSAPSQAPCHSAEGPARTPSHRPRKLPPPHRMPSQLPTASSKPPAGRGPGPRTLSLARDRMWTKSTQRQKRAPPPAPSHLPRLRAQGWGAQHFLPLEGAWQASQRDPEPDTQRLCGCLATRQAASFPGAHLMSLGGLKRPVACVSSLLAQFQEHGPGWGPEKRCGRRAHRRPHRPPLPCQSLLPVPTGRSEET